MASLLPTPKSAGPSSGPGDQSSTKEYTVRVPNDSSKKHSMIKFSSGTNIDFLKLTNTTVKLERENNLREYKSVYNIEAMPKFGAGSEYGREQKEEARRKKYGINIKKYDPEAQPWLMKVGKGKDAKRYKGVREGTITENTSYYIFTQCADGAFEAFPIEEWYNFQPVVSYKYLNSEEAEEEFLRRDKTLNKFSIMVRRRIKNEGDDGENLDDEEPKSSKSKKKKDKSLILTDMDEWGFGSEEDDDDNDEDGEEGERKPKEKKKTKKDVKRKKNSKMNAQDEAIEESDEGDFDDRELDYITDSGSESDMDEKDKEEKYDDKGVDQEQGLKKLIDSEEETSDEEDKKNEEEEEEEPPEGQEKGKKKKKENKDKDAAGESDSSSSSSDDDDDSDIEKNEGKFSVLFMQKKKAGSRSNTPTFDKSADAVKTEAKAEGLKRKMDTEQVTDSAKKSRTESPVLGVTAASPVNPGEITEDTIRRYLMRKPMTAKELLHKFKSKKPQMSKNQMTQKIGKLLNKINPDKKYVNNILYLSVKKTG